MRISDWSSDVCSSDLARADRRRPAGSGAVQRRADLGVVLRLRPRARRRPRIDGSDPDHADGHGGGDPAAVHRLGGVGRPSNWVSPKITQPTTARSEEHTSELQSLMRISYAVFCLKKKKTNDTTHTILLTTQT